MTRRFRLLTGLLAGGLVLTSPATALAAGQHPTPEHAPQPSPAPAPPAPAPAGPPPGHVASHPADGMEDHRTRCLSAVDERLKGLERTASHLDDDAHLTDEHRAALVAGLADASAGLRALAEKIKADGDPSQLQQHCALVVTDYPVGSFYLPRAHLVAVADAAAHAAARLGEVGDRLKAAIGEAAARGDDVAAAEAHLQTMQRELDAARAAAADVAGSILGLKVADWTADHHVLRPALEALHSARQHLHDAHALARQVLVDLHA